MTMYFPVTLQTLHDAGLNPFAVQLLAESYARHPEPHHAAFVYETTRDGKPAKVWIRMDPAEPTVEDDVQRLKVLLEEVRGRLFAAIKEKELAEAERDVLKERREELRSHIGSVEDDCPASLIAYIDAYTEGVKRALKIMEGEL